MVSITAATFSDLVDDDDLAAADSEKIIDQAIDLLNLYGETDEEIGNLSGTEGTKTATVQGYERGAILTVSRIIYLSFFKNKDGSSAALGPASYSSSDIMANSAVMNMVQTQAQLIAKRRTDTDEIEADTG